MNNRRFPIFPKERLPVYKPASQDLPWYSGDNPSLSAGLKQQKNGATFSSHFYAGGVLPFAPLGDGI